MADDQNDHTNVSGISLNNNLTSEQKAPEKPSFTQQEADYRSSSNEQGGQAAQNVEQNSQGNNLESQIKDLQLKLAEMENKYLRSQAEQMNLRKRFEEERRKITLFANEAILKDFVAPIDHLFMALKTKAPENGSQDFKNLYMGLDMVSKEFMTALKKNGITRISPLGQPFDYNKCQAMKTAPKQNPEQESNIVIQVIQEGYEIRGKVIKPALVVVSE